MTGDFNQAGGYLEECTYHAVRFYEKERQMELGTVNGVFLVRLVRSALYSSIGLSMESIMKCL